MYDLIIFDCDGTLIHSDDAYYHAFCDTLVKFGHQTVMREEYQDRYSGKIIKDIIVAYADQNNKKLDPQFEAYYWTLEPGYVDKYISAIDGAGEAVAEIQKRIKTCIASNASVSVIKNGLASVGLENFFVNEVLFSSENVKLPKPAPDVFLHAAERMGHLPAKTIVIEDSVGGVQAGVAAGMKVIGFSGSALNPERKATALKKVGADIVFSHWKDILDHINSLTR